MSGTMMPTQAGPQIPPQLLALLQARMQGGQGAPMQGAPMQPQAPGPMQGAMQPQPQAPQQPPAGQPMPARSMQGIAPPMPSNMGPQGVAQQGRFGDKIMAHLTPGEIAVPPQLQTPAVRAALAQAFAQAGVSPQQFTAGSPFSSTNPTTGQPEFSLWSALLPVVGAIAGSFIPGIGTMAGAALGGGIGGAAGGAIDHQTPVGTLLSAAGGAAGGALGGASSGASSALNWTTPSLGWNPANAVGTESLSAATTNPLLAFGGGAAAGAAGTGAAGAGSSGILSGAGDFLKGLPLKSGLYAGIGAGLGGILAPPQTTAALPASFSKPMGPLNPNFGQILGSGQANAPSFANYNPFSAVAGPNPGYRFYPTS